MNTAEPAAGGRDRLLRAERSPSTETGNWRPTRDHTSAQVPIDPYAAVAHSDRGLVNAARARGYRSAECCAAVGAQDDVDLVDAAIDVNHEQVAERIPCRLCVAARHTRGYSATRPGRTAINRVRAENAVLAGQVRKGHDLVCIGRVDDNVSLILVVHAG